jgi:hypothetical protein
VKFGIALRNVGPPIAYSGDGFSVQSPFTSSSGIDFEATVEARSAFYELPSLIQIGLAYDFHLNENHILTGMGSFTSNAFSQDQYGIGAEYSFKNYLILRGGYLIEEKLESGGEGSAANSTFLTGASAGLSVQTPIGSEGGTLGFDYSFRASDPFDGVHSIGVRIDI